MEDQGLQTRAVAVRGRPENHTRRLSLAVMLAVAAIARPIPVA